MFHFVRVCVYCMVHTMQAKGISIIHFHSVHHTLYEENHVSLCVYLLFLYSLAILHCIHIMYAFILALPLAFSLAFHYSTHFECIFFFNILQFMQSFLSLALQFLFICLFDSMMGPNKWRERKKIRRSERKWDNRNIK